MSKILKAFKLKISICGAEPDVWREIIVPSDYSFALHVAIQDAVGWQDCHLHQFFLKDPFKGQSKRIAWPVPDMEVEIDERKALLKNYFKKVKDTIFYEYDFGDSWIHKIELKEIIDNQDNMKLPQIIDGANACPPEDCGGICGYYQLIESIKNPENEAHEDMMEWMGLDDPHDFNPAYFDKNEIKFIDPKKRLKEYDEGFNL